MNLRDFFLRFMSPAGRSEAEAESRQWTAICPRCQHRHSAWDVGGMRFRGIGKPVTLVRCPGCGKVSPHRFERTLS